MVRRRTPCRARSEGHDHAHAGREVDQRRGDGRPTVPRTLRTDALARQMDVDNEGAPPT